MAKSRRAPRNSFLREHSLSLILTGLVVLLSLLYARGDPDTHFGAFYGNAMADWLGVLVFVIATKYFFEIGSGESRQPAQAVHARVGQFIQTHSLSLVLALSGAAWLVVYARTDVDSKGGQLLGNIVSDWLQVLGLVVITKYARERDSKEGH